MILGTRGSPLARAQSGWVRDRLLAAHPGLDIGVSVIVTSGDRQQSAPPDAFFGGDGGDSAKGIFVKEIEEAMLAGRIDLAVHSFKDLPTDQPDGLRVCASPVREDPRDALVTREGLGLLDLPVGARVGTSSPRRAATWAPGSAR
jgi:hydroxymethylbilane synthase